MQILQHDIINIYNVDDNDIESSCTSSCGVHYSIGGISNNHIDDDINDTKVTSHPNVGESATESNLFQAVKI